MRVGAPKETKTHEYRVGLTPAGVLALTERGHSVRVEVGAGVGANYSDDDYIAAGAKIVTTAAEAWDSDLVVKVKEPLLPEYEYLRPDLTLFTYLHLAADKSCTEALMSSGTTAIGYETVRAANGSLPLLAPMSEVAGRLATQVGAYLLQRSEGGPGVLMGGVPGVPPARVVVLGGGTAGRQAATIASGMRADVTLLDIQAEVLRSVDREFHGRVRTIAASTWSIDQAIRDADLVIGAVLVPGAKAPHLVSHDQVLTMRDRAVLVDIAIDQGGCFEDSRPTTHANPTYDIAGRTFYCVANMPGSVPVTSTAALTAATLPYALLLADGGPSAFDDPGIRSGLQVQAGSLLNEDVAAAHGLA